MWIRDLDFRRVLIFENQDLFRRPANPEERESVRFQTCCRPGLYTKQCIRSSEAAVVVDGKHLLAHKLDQ